MCPRGEGKTRHSITRAWALHRARRTGGDPAAYGEARTLSPAALKLKAGAAAWGPGTGSGGLPTPWERLRHRARNLHLRREAGPFLQWLSRRGLRLLLRSIRRSSG